MSGPPAQGYKLSGEGNAGGGPDGSKGGNTSSMTSGGGERDFTHQDANGPAQEIAGTLPNNFTLANTKAESKGEDRQEIYSHDVDTPANKPHLQAQRNEGYKPINSS